MSPAKNLEADLERWRAEGLIDAAAAEGIREYEGSRRRRGDGRLGVLLAWSFGGVLVGAGVLLFVAAHWDRISPAFRFGLVLLLTVAFHLAAGALAGRVAALSTVLHAVGTAALGAGIFLAGQIFHLQEHWPGALLLWAVGAWGAWALLRAWPQAVWAAILTPAWLVGEWTVAAERLETLYSPVWPGLALLAVAYLAAVSGCDEPSPTRRALAWLGGLWIIPGTALVAAAGGWGGGGHLEAVSERLFWLGWGLAILGPLVAMGVLRKKPPVAGFLAAFWVVLLASTSREGLGAGAFWAELGPYLLCALGALGMTFWGLRESRPERVNLGVAGFGITVVAYYFSSVMEKLDRSLSLLGLGVLFLLLGWGLERARRRLLAALHRPEGGKRA